MTALAPGWQGDWQATEAVRTEVLDPWRAAALHATLDAPGPGPGAGDALPPLWHWLYFLPLERQAELGADGHPRKGGFLPPVPLPRRMWAASDLRLHAPLVLGQPAEKRSRVLDVVEKTGRSGLLCFVTVEHRLSGPHGLAVTETQTVVYRAAPAADDPAPPPPEAPLDETLAMAWQADEALLFRYSALTFNGHRIHYDQPYATAVEGHAGLVVHGPLQATLMAELLRRERPDAAVTGFRFQARSPVYAGSAFTVAARPDADGSTAAWVRSAEGHLGVSGTFAHD